MAMLSEVLNRFEPWTSEFDLRNLPRLDKQLVHRYEPRNVFVSRIERVDDSRPDDFIGQFAFDPDHPFFFEHPLDHVPGLMLIEAGRQFGTAVAHLFYDVAFDNAFILNNVNVRFERFAELNLPVFANCTVRDKVYKRDRLMGMTFDGSFVQNNEDIGSMRAGMVIYDRRILARMRRGAVQGSSQLVS